MNRTELIENVINEVTANGLASCVYVNDKGQRCIVGVILYLLGVSDDKLKKLGGLAISYIMSRKDDPVYNEVTILLEKNGFNTFGLGDLQDYSDEVRGDVAKVVRFISENFGLS